MVPLLGCGCMAALLAASAPRALLLFLWIFTPYVDRAFATFIGPLFGLAFLPYTTLMYVIVHPVVGLSWLWVIFGFIIDLSCYAASAHSNREQIEGYPIGGYPTSGYAADGYHGDGYSAGGYRMEPSYGYSEPDEW